MSACILARLARALSTGQRAQIRLLIHQGALGVGDPLPTVRSLAVELGINANTVARVYRDLQDEGVLRLERGFGTFVAEDALTKDTVPVNVDAGLFWVVTDAQRAILEVQEYLPAISWAAQTTLRDVIGRSEPV